MDDYAVIEPGTVLGKGRYKVKDDLGFGTYGHVLTVTDLQNPEKHLAAKIEADYERKDSPLEGCDYLLEDIPASVRNDYNVMKTMEETGLPGFPRIHDLDKHNGRYFIVMDKIGRDLSQIFGDRQECFSLKDMLLLTDQLLDRIHALHSQGMIHGDLKPDNICMGYGQSASTVHLIDFGLTTMYMDVNTGKHFRSETVHRVGGTVCFMSVSNHDRILQTRKDDMESLSYVLAYFLRHGNMPWDDLRDRPLSEHRLTMDRKQNTTAINLFWGQPREFAVFHHVIRDLAFDERPPYEDFKNMFRHLGRGLGIDYENEQLNLV